MRRIRPETAPFPATRPRCRRGRSRLSRSFRRTQTRASHCKREYSRRGSQFDEPVRCVRSEPLVSTEICRCCDPGKRLPTPSSRDRTWSRKCVLHERRESKSRAAIPCARRWTTCRMSLAVLRPETHRGQSENTTAAPRSTAESRRQTSSATTKTSRTVASRAPCISVWFDFQAPNRTATTTHRHLLDSQFMLARDTLKCRYPMLEPGH